VVGGGSREFATLDIMVEESNNESTQHLETGQSAVFKIASMLDSCLSALEVSFNNMAAAHRKESSVDTVSSARRIIAIISSSVEKVGKEEIDLNVEDGLSGSYCKRSPIEHQSTSQGNSEELNRETESDVEIPPTISPDEPVKFVKGETELELEGGTTSCP
jgi:hypothetical protein